LLSAKAELSNELAVASNVAVTNIIEHATAATHQHQQTTTTVVVLLVHLEVVRQLIDAVSK
jgi:hypothetical protein